MLCDPGLYIRLNRTGLQPVRPPRDLGFASRTLCEVRERLTWPSAAFCGLLRQDTGARAPCQRSSVPAMRRAESIESPIYLHLPAATHPVMTCSANGTEFLINLRQHPRHRLVPAVTQGLYPVRQRVLLASPPASVSDLSASVLVHPQPAGPSPPLSHASRWCLCSSSWPVHTWCPKSRQELLKRKADRQGLETKPRPSASLTPHS